MGSFVFDFLTEYDKAGAANTLFQPWTFVDESVFLTKSRALGAVFRVTGVDYECLDPGERAAVVRRWLMALRLWDEHHRLYQYLLKTRHPDLPAERPNHPIARQAVAERLAWFDAHRHTLYAFETYTIVLYEDWATRWPHGVRDFIADPMGTAREWASTGHGITVLDEELTRAVHQLRTRAAAWQAQLAETLRPVLLPATDAYGVLWRLANLGNDRPPQACRHDVPLDRALAHSHIEGHRDHLRRDGTYIRLLTLRDPPKHTWANQLEAVCRVPAPFVLCTEWRRESPQAIRRHLRSMQRHYHTSKVSMLTYLHNRRPARHEVLVDESAGALVDALGDALTAIELDDQYFGRFALTVAVYDDEARTLDRSCAEVVKAFASIEAVITEETYNGLNAWCATMPGNARHQLRYQYLLSTNAGDLSCLFTLHTGDQRNRYLNSEYLAVVETSHCSPYFLNVHYHDVGHALLLGATGSGKSFLANFLLTHAMKYEPRIMIFDLGGSYRRLTEWFDGRYVVLTLEPRETRINPFCLEPTRDNLNFLAAFVRVLIGPDRPLAIREERELHEQVANVYSLDPSLRRLGTLVDMLPRSLEAALSRWVRDGAYAAVFDHPVDTLTFASFQTFDLAGLERYPAVLEPLLFYVLHRATADVHDPQRADQLKICVVDEAWRFVRDPRIKVFLREALKTWRRQRAVMWLATQAAEDFVESDLLRTVIESCPTRLFLPNPGVDMKVYRELFNLNETEARFVRDLLPRQEFLLKRPDHAKVLTLRVDDKARALYTPAPPDYGRVDVRGTPADSTEGHIVANLGTSAG